MDYYKIKLAPNGRPFLSNSGINEIFGTGASSVKKETLLFGVAFHSLVLEPHLPQPKVSKSQQEMLYVMANKVFCDPSCSYILKHKDTKKEHELYKFIFGFWFKAKLDMILHDTIYDLKTTASRDRATFIKSVKQYYLQQMAVYFAMYPLANKFTFIGVRKTKYIDKAELYEYTIMRNSELHFIGYINLIDRLEKLHYDLETNQFIVSDKVA